MCYFLFAKKKPIWIEANVRRIENEYTLKPFLFHIHQSAQIRIEYMFFISATSKWIIADIYLMRKQFW